MSTNQLRQSAQNGQSRRPESKNIVELLRSDKVKAGLRDVATKYLTHDRILKLAVNAVTKTPNLQRCDPTSVLGAIMASTALGLEPNTTEQQAFLIPYKRRAKIGNDWVDVWDCQFQIGYRGYITLAHRIPGMGKFQSEAIHQNDRFKFQLGSETFLEYEKRLYDRGDLIGAFCYTELGESEAATVLPLDEILKIRGRSETHKALTNKVRDAQLAFERDENATTRKALDQAAAKLADTPWELWEDDMAAKSAIKKHCKKLPKAQGLETTALGVAAELDGDSAKLIDIGALADAEYARAIRDGEEDVPVDSSDDRREIGHEPGMQLDPQMQNSERAGEKVVQRNSNRDTDNDGEDLAGMTLE